ncbi:MAG: HEPN domain-containing protein [Phycisphaerales bacterium]
MGTWSDMSRQSYKAAEHLQRLRNFRSCISRAYYAAFSAVTDGVRKYTTRFDDGYEHPPHRQVSRFVRKHLTQFSKSDRQELARAVERLRQARLDADYRHKTDPTDLESRLAMIDAKYVLNTLGLL